MAMQPNLSNIYTTKNSFLIVVLVSFILRLSFFAFEKPWQEPTKDNIILVGDAIGYHDIANTFLRHQKFALKKSVPPDALRTPVYPLYLSILYAAFGSKPWIVLFSQVFIDTLSCIFLLIICRKLFDPKAAFFAASFYSIDPFAIFYSCRLLSDTLFVCLLLIGFYFFSTWVRQQPEKKSLYKILLSGFFFALATLDRPIAIYLPIILLLFISVHSKKNIRRAIAYSLMFLISFVLTISPWMIRNKLTFNSFSISTSQNFNLLILDVVPMEMERRGQSEIVTTQELLQEVDNLVSLDGAKSETLNQFELTDYYQKVAIKYIKKYPISFGKHYFLGIVHSMFNLNTFSFTEALHLKASEPFNINESSSFPKLIASFWKHKTFAEKLIGILTLLFLAISYACGLIGIFIGLRNKRTSSLYCLIFACYFIVLTGTGGLVRFKLPSIPFYCCFIGLGVSKVLNIKGRTSFLQLM